MKKTNRPRTVGPAWLRWVLFTAGAVCMGLAIVVAIQWVATGSLAAVWKWAVKYPHYLGLTTLFYTLVIYVLGAAMGRLWAAGAMVGAVGLCLSLVDYFKTAINGTPLEVADFGLATQLGQVAGVAGALRPPVDFWRSLAALAFCVFLLVLTRRVTVIRGRARFLSGSVALALALSLCTAAGAATAGEGFQVDMFTRLDAASSHDTYGLTLSLWRSLFLQNKASPEGYSQEQMDGVLARIDELLAGDVREEPAVQPNIIMVLSESFYDVTGLPDLQFDRDPVENFHALQAESLSGAFHSHYLGYGTGYIEMSMLYGLNSLDLGPGTNICFMEDDLYQRFDSVVEQFTGEGDYRAEMLHGYNDSLYNRTVTYPLLGFSDLLFSQDIQSLGFPWEDGVYGGYYMKDSYFFHAMLDRMQSINDGGQRAFLYGITMENHQPFDPEKFGYECQVDVTSSVLSEEDMAIVRVMVEGITRADRALGELTDLLRESEEPTVVVFFGDHRPNLFMTDGDTVYTKLGLCPQNDTVGWTVDQVNDLYSTDYLIWANDAALSQGWAGTRRDTSVTGLGPLLLELTGRPVSRYWALLERTSGTSLTNTDLYFVDGQGVPSTSQDTADLTAEQRELLDLREMVIYDAVYGQQYITAAMNDPAGT